MKSQEKILEEVEAREEAVASLVTSNGIRVGDTVVYIGGSSLFPRQNDLAQAVFRTPMKHKVSWIFLGDSFEQIELETLPDQAWVCDMFLKVPERK